MSDILEYTAANRKSCLLGASKLKEIPGEVMRRCEV